MDGAGSFTKPVLAVGDVDGSASVVSQEALPMHSLWDRVVSAHEDSVRAHQFAAELFARCASPQRSALAVEHAAAARTRAGEFGK